MLENLIQIAFENGDYHRLADMMLSLAARAADTAMLKDCLCRANLARAIAMGMVPL